MADGGGSGVWESQAAPTNVVVVNSLDDFPTPSAGTITLADDTKYVLGAALSTSDNFVMGSYTVLSTGSPFQNTLTYTGSGNMFTAVDNTFSIADAKLSCPSGTVFNVAHTVTNTYITNIFRVLIEDCTNVGTFTNNQGLVLNRLSVLNCTDGITIGGTNLLVDITQALIASGGGASFTGVDLGVSVNTFVTFNNVQVSSTVAGATGISGAASNANISAGSVAQVTNCSFVGLYASVLSGITVDDVRWRFDANDGISDTFKDGLLSMSGNATDTVPGASSTPTLVAGTWTVQDVSHFTGTTGGRITYDGEATANFPVTAVISQEPVSGTNQDVRLYIAKNGTAISGSGITRRTDSGNPGAITTIWQVEMATNDYVELFVSNETSATDITVIDAILRVN